MPPRRATRQSSASTATVESTPEPAPRVRRQTRASVASSLQDEDEEGSDDDTIPEEEDSLLDEESDREPVAVKRETRARGARPPTAPTANVKRSRTSSTKEAVVQPKTRTRASRGTSTLAEANETVAPRRSARLSLTPTPESPSLANQVEGSNGKARRKRVVKSDSEEGISEQDEPMDVDQDGNETIQAPSTRKSSEMTPQSPNDTAEIDEDESEASDVEEDLIDKSLRFAGSRSATPLAAPTKPAEAILQPSTRQNLPVEIKPSVVVEKGPKKRLVIRKMALVNFKSYRGRQEIGPFHKSFSAIVGPNGSGKSNTIDAMLFVFGYRASKMRQGKLSELIHNSEGSEDLDSCSVEVWFEEIIDKPGSDAYEVVPGSQLIVARTAHRNNSSKYTINDRNSNFSEVTTLLKSRGIDLDHKRFLILQGEVESIAQMKPKGATEHEDGLLEYLEDIIGTSKYKQPIEDAQIKVDEFNEARGERLGRLKLVEREKSGLEAKKQEAESYLRDSNELTRKKSLLYQFHIHTLNNNITITNKMMETHHARLVVEQEKNAGNLAEIDALTRAYNEKLEAFDEVKKHVDVLLKDAKKFGKEELSLGEKKKHLAAKQKKLKKTLSENRHARSEAAHQFDSQGEEIDKIRNQINEMEHRLVKEEADLEEVRDSLKDKTDGFTSQIEALQLELEPWVAKINSRQSAVDVANSEKTLLAGKAIAGQKALDAAHLALDELMQTVQSKREEQRSLTEESSELQKGLQTAQNKLQTLQARAESSKGKATTARQRSDEAKSSLAANKSENAVLNTLTKLRTQGRLKGFHGRLGDLGVIDDKYDVAVTTACGALNNLVVDTVEQGQACIEVLRRGNVGRASIMVLDKLPPRDLAPIETPEGVPRLFDLIKPKDPKFAQAFYKGLFNTLVADDLQQAQRIGYGKKRWRVVTLAGQLIDPSGTMSGGGARVQKGGMSSKFSGEAVEPEVLAKYEEELALAEADLVALQTARKEAEAEMVSIKKRIPVVEIALEKLQMDLNTSDARLANAKERLREVANEAKPNAEDQKRITGLDKEIAENTKDLDKLKSKTSSIESRIKDLQEKILEVGGVKLRALQSKVTNTRSLIDLAGDNLTKAEVARAKAERDSEKLDKSLAADTGKMEELETELETIEADWKACVSDLQTIQSKVDEAQTGMEDVQDILVEAKKELEEKTTSINSFRALEVEVNQKIDEQTKLLKDHNAKLRHWEKRFQDLELVHVDDEEDDDDEDMDEEQEEGTRSSSRRNKSAEDAQLVEHSADELEGLNRDVLNAEITQLEEELGRMKPNLNVLAEYRKRESEFLDRARDLDIVTKDRDQAKQQYDDLRKTRLEEFMVGFSTISSKLKEMYQMITLGGNAELELVDSMDPFSEGIIFSVMPPKKSWKNISNLSGGEKTLSSLALVFALHVFKPTPLYFMDEIDAALDFRNVSIIANYIKSKTEAAQFIIISLRNDMFELSHRLVGIYKTNNSTKSIAIDNKDIRTQARKAQENHVSVVPV